MIPFFILLALPVFVSEETIVSRLQACMCLKCDAVAVDEVKEALKAFPQSSHIHRLALRIFAKAGLENELNALLKQHANRFPEDALTHDDLEEISWGIIEKGAKGSSPQTRAIALIAASLGNDARGTALLAISHFDPHRQIRVLAAEFSAHFRDESLQEVVLKRLEVEKDPLVRESLLACVGPMNLSAAEPYLLKVLEQEGSHAEHKLQAIASLLELKKRVDPAEVRRFVNSNRAGIRALSAELIGLELDEQTAPLLLDLLKDSHSEVRRAALDALGKLRVNELNGVAVHDLINPSLHDLSSSVAITAAWVLMLHTPKEGQKALEKWFQSADQDERLQAACALAAAGKYGFPLTVQAFRHASDPYVKLNLAIALVQQGIHSGLGLKSIHNAVVKNQEKWMTKEFGNFEGIAPCETSYKPDIPNYPEAVNQITRLELLNLLAVKEYPGALEAVLQFLRERPWGIAGTAAALLLTEGDSEAISLVRTLLNDPVEKVQLQAALLLALWGNDPEAISVLQRLYPQVSRQKKEQILEALGKIGHTESIPFLIERLHEPYQSLRMIAAVAILQTLYH